MQRASFRSNPDALSSHILSSTSSDEAPVDSEEVPESPRRLDKSVLVEHVARVFRMSVGASSSNERQEEENDDATAGYLDDDEYCK